MPGQHDGGPLDPHAEDMRRLAMEKFERGADIQGHVDALKAKMAASRSDDPYDGIQKALDARTEQVVGSITQLTYTPYDRNPLYDAVCKHPARDTVSVSREYLEFAVTALMHMDPDHVLTLPNGNQMTVYSLKAAWSALLR